MQNKAYYLMQKPDRNKIYPSMVDERIITDMYVYTVQI